MILLVFILSLLCVGIYCALQDKKNELKIQIRRGDFYYRIYIDTCDELSKQEKRIDAALNLRRPKTTDEIIGD